MDLSLDVLVDLFSSFLAHFILLALLTGDIFDKLLSPRYGRRDPVKIGVWHFVTTVIIGLILSPIGVTFDDKAISLRRS